MTDRFARAQFQEISADKYHGIVIIRVGNGDYFELTALDRYHAETKLHEFARTNKLILIEVAGFSNGSRAARGSGGNTGRRLVSPVAATRSSSQPHRSPYKQEA
ncbi:MAG: hypothetical protein WC329_02895 [Candidatus Omnitrophota bacterium]